MTTAAEVRVGLPGSFVDEVDRLRGLFAFMVLFGHAMDISFLTADPDYLLDILGQLRPMLGFVWVVGFVVVSGFCIELSCRRREKFSLGEYSLKRITRIYPLLVVCVLITGLLEALMAGSPFRPPVWTSGIDQAHFLTNLWGGGGFFGQFGSIAPAYTISYELFYYTIWGASRTLFKRRIPAAFMVNAALVPLFVFVIAGFMDPAPAILKAVLNPFVIMIYLPWLLGAMVAAYLEKLAAIRLVRTLGRFSWIFLFLVLLIGWGWHGMPSFEVNLKAFVYYGLLGLAFAAVIIGAFVKRRSHGDSSEAKVFGELSYPLYLIHGPIIVLAGFLLNRTGARPTFMAHYLVLVFGAVLAAAILVALVERPVMRLRSDFFRRGKPSH